MKEDDERTAGLLCGYVDDQLNSGNEIFESLTEQTLQSFDSKLRVLDNVEFEGVFIKMLPGTPRSFTLSQEPYITAARKLPIDITFDAFVSARAVF